MKICRGRSGGLICINSFVLGQDRQQAGRFSLRVASHSLRTAAREGLESLYADPEDVLEKYKDFDIVKAMSDRKGSKLLWVRARSIDADVVNANGDYFSEKELLADVEVKGEKIPAYKTFEGVPIYTNHKNDDIEQAKGMVVYAEWDEDEKCVWCTFFIDEEAYPEIAQGIRVGYMHDVSMGCQVGSGVCSQCGNVATVEREYCDCLKDYKGKTDPKTGKKVYEKNKDLKFIELSVVGDGAFDSCEIEEIYDTEEILEKAVSLKRKAQAIHGSILLAETMCPSRPSERIAYEECLRTISSATSDMVRHAQTAGTLVGGQIMAQEGAAQNSTVGNILKLLGLDPQAGLNVLDMLNLALNFLEVAVMNLFARKDNVDLAHVGKITKSMADLQAAMQDMIDDGIDAGGGGGRPLNQGGMPGAQQAGGMGAPGGAPPPAGSDQDYQQAGQVGRAMGPANTQNQLFMLPPSSGIGGGAVANTLSPRVVWASEDAEEESRLVMASRRSESASYIPPSLLRAGESILSLGRTLGLSAPGSEPDATTSNTRAAKSTNQHTKHNAPQATRVAGGNMQNVFSQIADKVRKRNTAKFSVDTHFDGEGGTRITLSSDGSVKAFVNGNPVGWSTSLTDAQADAIDAGNIAGVGQEVLSSFVSAVRTAQASGKTVVAGWDPNHPDDVMEHQLEAKRTGTFDKVQEHLLAGEEANLYKRKGTDKDVKEKLLEDKRTGNPDDVMEHQLEDAGLYSSKTGTDDDVKEHLLADARKGNPDEVIERQLADVRKNYGPGLINLVVKAGLNAIANTVLASQITPEEAVSAAAKLASKSNLPELILLASLGSKSRKTIAARAQFHKQNLPVLTASNALLDSLGAEVNDDVLPMALAETLAVVASETSKAVGKVTRLAQAKMGDNTYSFEPSSSRRTVSRADQIRAALATEADSEEDAELVTKLHIAASLHAMAEAAQETRVTPAEVIACVASADAEDLLQDVSLARTSSATEDRLTRRARLEFWGQSRTASKQNIYDSVTGWLADYAEVNSVPTALVVEAARKVASKPAVAEQWVQTVINADRQERNAAISVTDEKITTKRLQCRAEELGLDTKSESFDEEFRSKAIEILASSGYHVDPNTFSLTDVNVSGSGDITASVTTRFSKTFDADASSSSMDSASSPDLSQGATDVTTVAEGTALPDNKVDAGMEPSVEPGVPQEQQMETISTAAYKAASRRRARREALRREAQMGGMPGGGAAGGGMGGAGGGMGASPMGGDMGAGADGPGIGALTQDPTGADDPTKPDADPDADAMSEPGTKKPWGSICPECGSSDVDVANGEGNCRSCGSQLKYTFKVEVVPQNDDDKKDGPGATDKDKEPALGDDMGLGGATAPAPGGGAPPAPGGAPPAPGGGGAPPGGGMPMASSKDKNVRTASKQFGVMGVSYITDSDIFIRCAQTDFNRTAEPRLPVGMICPNCGNRHAEKLRNKQTFCGDCNTISAWDVKNLKERPGKVLASIRWVVKKG